MKKLILIIVYALSGLLTQAQEKCSDIIYLVDGESIIFNCCIEEVKHNNVVYYTTSEDTTLKSTEAISIIKDGQT